MTLPDGWVEATIEEVSSPENRAIVDGPFGSALKSEHYVATGVRVIRLGNVGDREFLNTDAAFISEERFRELVSHEAVEGDLITAALGDPLGRTCAVPPDLGRAIVKADCFRTRLSGQVDSRYVLATLNAPQTRESFVARGRGVGRVRINLEVLRSTLLPLPPLAEQRRIVAKLDSLTARLGRARAELDRVPVLAKRLRDNSLRVAFNGTLIEEEGQPRSSWSTVPFERAAEIASNLVDPAEIGALPHIAPNHISSGLPRLLPYKTIAEDEVISGKHRFFPGQIIYSKIRPYLRKVVLVDFEGACSADMYPINARCNSRYLMYWMLSPEFTWLATQKEGRTVLPKINQNALNSIPTPLAPKPIQAAIASRLDVIFARADRMEAEAARARALLDRLEAAILAKAFRGELVPQDPKDEPASVLLDRIRAQRAAAPKAKRGGRDTAHG